MNAQDVETANSVVGLFFMLLFGVAGYYVARWRGHQRPWIGAIVAGLFSFIGLIIVALIPGQKKKEVHP